MQSVQSNGVCTVGNPRMDGTAGNGKHLMSARIDISLKHWWFSGRILACHAGGPGSIPGQCIFLNFFNLDPPRSLSRLVFVHHKFLFLSTPDSNAPGRFLTLRKSVTNIAECEWSCRASFRQISYDCLS